MSTGSPFTCCVVDVGSLSVDWDSVRLRPVHCPVNVVLDTKGSPEADIACTVTGRSRTESISNLIQELAYLMSTELISSELSSL